MPNLPSSVCRSSSLGRICHRTRTTSTATPRRSLCLDVCGQRTINHTNCAIQTANRTNIKLNKILTHATDLCVFICAGYVLLYVLFRRCLKQHDDDYDDDLRLFTYVIRAPKTHGIQTTTTTRVTNTVQVSNRKQRARADLRFNFSFWQKLRRVRGAKCTNTHTI